MKKYSTVYGVGVNDSNYSVKPTINGVLLCCPIYSTWKSMIRRCYSDNFQKQSKTYIGCSVTPEWHSFMAFRAWMMQQDWQGMCLDKDLIKQGNKVYSPETCLFITNAINTLMIDCSAQRGDYPIGVHFEYEKYKAQIKINCKNKHLGRFFTPIEAHAACQKAKAGHIEQIANKQTDERIKNALMLRVYQLRDDILNNRETIKL